MLTESPVYNNKADIWALGCIFYELLHGKRLFSNDWEISRLSRLQETTRSGAVQTQHSTHRQNLAVLFGFPGIDSVLSSHLRELVNNMLSIQPSDRPAAHALLDALLDTGFSTESGIQRIWKRGWGNIVQTPFTIQGPSVLPIVSHPRPLPGSMGNISSTISLLLQIGIAPKLCLWIIITALIAVLAFNARVDSESKYVGSGGG
jgi:serine/threonine protein kinase